jgi:glycosyltransferase involved in cell wall biosynthesis
MAWISHDTASIQRKRIHFEKTLGLGNKIVLGVAARLTAVKGHEFLFKALSKLSEHNVILLVIGSGPLDQQLQDLVKTLGIAHQTRFIGFQENLPAVFSVLDILVHPSLSEGLGQVIMEGMLMGLPIVASPVRPIDELMTHNVHGLLFNPGDVDALVRYLGQLIASPERRKVMGSAGKQHALECFGIERMMRAYEGIYERLIG